MMASDEEYTLELQLYIEIFERFGPNAKPAIRLSKILSNKDDVVYILKKALEEKSIPAKITLKNKLLAVPKLARLNLIDPNDL
jgi:hypothetical protein